MDTMTKTLYESIANNDLINAKKCVKALLESNNKKCDQFIKSTILTKLNSSNLNLIELPYNIKGFLEVEDVKFTFEEDRYVINDEDKKIINQVINTYKVSDTLLKYNIKYLNSLLLYGMPGCGKTMLGKYIAYKLDMPFAYLNFSNLISSYLGKTGENLQKVFDYILTTKCVFMLDEIDAIGLERGTDTVGVIIVSIMIYVNSQIKEKICLKILFVQIKKNYFVGIKSK